MRSYQDNKILIAGAGPAGLALAQILRKRGIPYEIFERDDVNHVRKQGWAIAIVEAAEALEGMLPDDLPDLRTCSVNAPIGEDDEITVIHADTGERLSHMGHVPKGQPGYFLRADRDGFRKLLFTNLNVSMGKNFDHYVEDADGVTVYFKDGTSARGAILVGADGAHSHIRSQLMANTNHQTVQSEYIPLFGEVELSPEWFEPLRAVANTTLIAGRTDLRILMGQRRIQADKSSASYYWSVMYRSKTPEADNAWAHKATKEEMFQKVLEVTEGILPLLLNVIKYTGPEGVVLPPLTFSEFVPPNQLPVSRVTLLGDAAHAMIPFKGAGANTAILDTLDLANVITKHHKTDESMNWPEILQEYEALMLPRGKNMVLASRAAGQSDGGLLGVTHGRHQTQ